MAGRERSTLSARLAVSTSREQVDTRTRPSTEDRRPKPYEHSISVRQVATSNTNNFIIYKLNQTRHRDILRTSCLFYFYGYMMDLNQPNNRGPRGAASLPSSSLSRAISPRQDGFIVGSGDGSLRSSGTGGAMAGVTTTISTMVTTQQSTEVPPTLLLSLRPRSNVTWDEGVINNEGLGRKSSKRCCIFHKQRAFGESSTESSEDQSGDDDDGSSSSSSSGGGGSGKARRPMARKKDKKKKSGGISNKPKIPDHQRFHA